MACPYSWDVPGGVQFHIRDLAEHLIGQGHEVSVLAPADEDEGLPDYVVPAGRAVPVPYNGSVARLAFGPLSAARVRRWLADGSFDVVHAQEPVTPSLSILACWAATDQPLVGTFHTSNLRSRAMAAGYPILYPTLEKISARIAVSEEARRTLVDHLGGDAVVIPNGVYVDRLAAGRARPQWRGPETPTGGTVGFLGRLDEPRKGLSVLLEAVPAVLAVRPEVCVLVAGQGNLDELQAGLAPAVREAVHFLGPLSEADKIDMLATLDVYVAPNLGGESFGIILAEAMAAGATVLASDLASFRAVLDDGSAGELFPVGDSAALADRLLSLLANAPRRAALQKAGSTAVRRYDWPRVADSILAVYETVLAGQLPPVEPPPEGFGATMRRWLR